MPRSVANTVTDGDRWSRVAPSLALGGGGDANHATLLLSCFWIGNWNGTTSLIGINNSARGRERQALWRAHRQQLSSRKETVNNMFIFKLVITYCYYLCDIQYHKQQQRSRHSVIWLKGALVPTLLLVETAPTDSNNIKSLQIIGSCGAFNSSQHVALSYYYVIADESPLRGKC